MAQPFIVIEGTDGVGKGTQTEILKDRLIKEGYKVSVFDFPRYGEPSAQLVESYLNGKLGTASENNPYVGSTYYAVDRFHAAKDIKAALAHGDIILCNRYVGSNMAHQGQKIEDDQERESYYKWLHELEFVRFGIPKPSLNIVLTLDAEVSQKLIDTKEKRDYTNKKRDLHEADLKHLENAKKVYEEMCEIFSEDFVKIDCNDTAEGVKSREQIHELIWSRVGPLVKGQ